MKLKVIVGCILVAAILSITTPVLALSIGVSPSRVELEVPGNGSTTINVNIHYFDGDVDISLIDIPLRIEPSTIHVDASDEPVAIELTIYGDDSLGSRIYDGYIRFIAVSGGAATGGVQVIAKITNVVEGVTPTEPVVEEPAPETTSPETVVEESATPIQEATTVPTTITPKTNMWPMISITWIIAGVAAVITMAVIIVFARRRRCSNWQD